MERSEFLFLGFGVGLRRQHYGYVIDTHPGVDWFEVVSENFMIKGVRPLQVLEKVRKPYPIVLHGVSMSIGSIDPLNRRYLADLPDLSRRFEPAWISDHLCWTGVSGRNLHDLLPLPYTDEAVRWVSARIRQVQEALERTILIENVSSYMRFVHSTMNEGEFLTAVAEESDCGILLEINNVFVSAFNRRFDARTYIESVPIELVAQYHLAGAHRGSYLTHDHPIATEVWALYQLAAQQFGEVSALIEWDDRIPEFPILEAATEEAQARHRAAARERSVSEGVCESV